MLTEAEIKAYTVDIPNDIQTAQCASGSVQRMVRPFWVSWEQTPEMSSYTIRSPWWTSGHIPHPDGTRFTICCAIQAEDQDDAKNRILRSFDVKPENMEWRFVMEKPTGWSPFCERFPRAAWMVWPNEKLTDHHPE